MINRNTPYFNHTRSTVTKVSTNLVQTAELACSLAGGGELTLKQSSSVEFVPCFIKRVNRYKD